MSVAATLGRSSAAQSLHVDNKRWAVSFVAVLALHAVATVFILYWYQNLPAPLPVPPA